MLILFLVDIKLSNKSCQYNHVSIIRIMVFVTLGEESVSFYSNDFVTQDCFNLFGSGNNVRIS